MAERESLWKFLRRGTLALLAARRPVCLILGHRWMFLGVCERCGNPHRGGMTDAAVRPKPPLSDTVYWMEGTARDFSDPEERPGPQGLSLNGEYHAIDCDELTGAEIRALPNPSIRDDYDLFVTAEGKMDVKVDYDKRIFARNRVFITAPRFINAA